MTGFSDFLAADRRLFILRLLAEIGGSGSESVLHDGLRAVGHRRGVTRDVVRDGLKFLQNCGCVTLEWYSDTVMVATITKRGVDVSRGDVVVEGVKQPSIGV